MSPEDGAPDPVEVWPENHAVVRMFLTRLGGQWKVGMNGVTGLDYTVPFKLMDRMNLTDTEYDEMLDKINIFEMAAINAMNGD